jgi:hypothetical protein
MDTPGADAAAMHLTLVSVLLAVLAVIASDYLSRKMQQVGINS